MTGTVNIARSLFDDEAFKDQPFTEREAFVWMIMEASWKPRAKRVGNVTVNLERGQLAASVRFMADAWKWEKSTVDRFLKRLEKRDMIGTASGTGVNVITICKYDEYQSSSEKRGTDKNEAPGQQRDSSGTNEKKGEIRDYSVANATDGDAVAPQADLAKDLFERGVRFLGKHGVKESQARAVIGKWRKDHPDADILSAFMDCAKSGAIDPIPWITARLIPPPTFKPDFSKYGVS